MVYIRSDHVDHLHPYPPSQVYNATLISVYLIKKGKYCHSFRFEDSQIRYCLENVRRCGISIQSNRSVIPRVIEILRFAKLLSVELLGLYFERFLFPVLRLSFVILPAVI